jgi:hypothetical protein
MRWMMWREQYLLGPTVISEGSRAVPAAIRSEAALSASVANDQAASASAASGHIFPVEGPSTYSLPRHPTHRELSLLELNGILCRGEPYL